MKKPRCAVRGVIHPRVMCGCVIVGGEFCGSDSACEHKVVLCDYCEGTGIDPESFRSLLELKCPACKEPANALAQGREHSERPAGAEG